MTVTKHNRFKRVLSLALAFMMCISMGSVRVFAEEADENLDIINWARLYGSNGTNSISTTCDSINDIKALTDGSYVVVGAFDGNGVAQADGQKGKTDAALMLYDSNGVMQKQTLVGGSNADYFYKVTEAGRGGFIAVGASQSEDGDLTDRLKGGYDGLIAQFDAEGNLLKTVTVGGTSKDELRDIIGTSDGGYVVVGYTQSNDGDLADADKTTTDRDALIVKLDNELNIQWMKTYGVVGSVTTGLDDFYSVKRCKDGSYIVAGGTGVTEGVASKEKDICIVKYSEDGSVLWEKVFGGSGDDYANCITVSPYKTEFTEDGDRFSDMEIVETGFVLTGTTKSVDGIFSNAKSENGIEKAFFIKVDVDGNIETVDLIENTVGTTGEFIRPVSDGYMITGICQSNDLDFTGAAVYGKKDFYIAHYSSLGNFLNMNVFGSDDDETVKGVIQGDKDDYILFGNTKSSSFYGNSLSGKYDGFILCADKTAIESYAEEKYLVPVEAWKENEDEKSMMSPLLYKDAYIEKTGEEYKVTVYFTNAVMMGTQVSASTLGSVSYELNGEMTSADIDEYDILTQVKRTTITLGSLSEPVKIYINGTMGSIRLVFDEENKISTDTPPYFAPVQVERPDFDCLWKTNIGGSDVDYSNSMTVLKDGTIAAVGQTYSNDGDFSNKLKSFSGAYINTYDSSGNFLSSAVLCGANPDSSAYASCIDAAEDGGYYVCGGYEESFDRDPSGDFAALNYEGSVHGQIDGYYAKYASDGQMIWMKGFSGSAYDQIKQIKATEDGGCVLLIETNSEDGDMTGLGMGIFDLLLIKCDKDGNEEWKKVISGSSMQSASFGTAILEDGSYIVGGYAYLGYTFGDFEDLTYFGNTFDLFAVKISENGELIWAKSYGGDGNDYCNGVTATSDGGFMMAGSTKSSTGDFEGIGTSYENPFIMKCDADGTIQWLDVLKSSEKGEAVKAVELAGKYIVLGSSYGMDFDFSNINKGSRDIFIANYDADGNRTFLDTIGGVNLDYAVDIVVSGGNRVSILFEGASTDGDLAGLNRGEYDGTLLTFEVDGINAVDKSVLKDILDQAKEIDNSDNKYTELSFYALSEAVKNAESVYANPLASQEDVDEQVNALQSAINELAENNSGLLDKNNLEDGTYQLYAYMFKPDRKNYSMADNAIEHQVQLDVIEGEYYITMQLNSLSVYNFEGFLSNIFCYEDGYTYNEYGVPEGNTFPVQVISTQKDSDGNDIIDQYNSADSLYPSVIRFKLASQAISDDDGFVPMNIFVPLMESIAAGNGTQDVLLKLDWSALTKITEEDPSLQPTDPIEQSPAVDMTDDETGVKIHAAQGVLEEGAKVAITEIASGAEYENAVLVLEDIGAKFKLYDINFYGANGAEILPNGTIKLSCPIEDGYDSSNLAVYRINDDGSKTLIKGVIEDGYYTVVINAAGKYALVEKDNETVSDLDKNNLKNGVYSIHVDMYKTNRTDKSMTDNAINHTAKLEAIDGEYFVTLDFHGITIENRFGYLKNLSYYAEGYSYGQYGAIEGDLISAETLSTQKDSDGNDVIDQYNDENNLYPDLVKIKLVPQAIADEDGYAPLHVFVPIMEAIAEGSGDQDVLMKLDWSTLSETTDEDPSFQPEEPIKQSPAVDMIDAATGVKIHADQGVFEEGVKIVVTEITSGEDYEKAVSSLEEIGAKFKLYDVKFYNEDGIEIAPNGTVEISYPVANDYDSSNLAVYRINDDGSKTLVKGVVEDGYYTIVTKTAGKYALVEKNDAADDNQNTENENNGQDNNEGNTDDSQNGDNDSQIGENVSNAENDASLEKDNVSQTKENLSQADISHIAVSAPQTGDNSNSMFYFLLAFVSAGMLGVLIFTGKRTSREGE